MIRCSTLNRNIHIFTSKFKMLELYNIPLFCINLPLYHANLTIRYSKIDMFADNCRKNYNQTLSPAE